MKLHENKELFLQAINQTSSYFKIDPVIIEKDYYITLLLNAINNKVEHLVFKGGTSLSKCYKAINRFSEDADLTLDPKFATNSNKSKMKDVIKKTCIELGLDLLNEESIRRRRDYNAYEIDYHPIFKENGVKSIVLVEVVFMVDSFPTEINKASSYIYDYFIAKNNLEVINNFELNCFEIATQSIERTFIDKIFAICDYSLSKKIELHSRHLYDIYKLYPLISFNEEFYQLFIKVKEERNKSKICLSAKEGFNMCDCLFDIIEKEVYKKDYQEYTSKLLFENISYEETINVLKKVLLVLSSIKIKEHLNKDIVVNCFEEIDSTSTYAKREKDNYQGDFLICASKQTAGRGRVGKKFFSPKNGTYFTIAFKVNKNIDYSLVTIDIGVAIVEALKKIYNIDCQIKWVNDIYYHGYKVGGILSEATMDEEGNLDRIYVGTGLNINLEEIPSELINIASTLTIKNYDKNLLVSEIINNLYDILDNSINVIDKYNDVSVLNGKIISFEKDGIITEGQVLRVNSEGNLIVKVDENEIVLKCGEVSLGSKKIE